MGTERKRKGETKSFIFLLSREMDFLLTTMNKQKDNPNPHTHDIRQNREARQNHKRSHTHDHHDHESHDHEHPHEDQQGQQRAHSHSHSHQQTKAVLNRISKAIGHLESIKRMIENGRDCSEVLIQIAAVKSAINNTGQIILKDHIEHCIVEAVEEQDYTAIEELNKAIVSFMK